MKKLASVLSPTIKEKLLRHWQCLKRANQRPDLLFGAMIGRKCGCGKSFWRILQGEC